MKVFGVIAVVVAVALCPALVSAVCPTLGNRVETPYGVGLYINADGEDVSTDQCHWDLTGVNYIHFTGGNLTVFTNSPFYNLPSLEGITFEEETDVTVYAGAFNTLPALSFVSFEGSAHVTGGMFQGCGKLDQIGLPFDFDFVYSPSSMCSADTGMGCERLRRITIDGKENYFGKHYKVVDGALFTVDGKELIQFPGNMYNPVLYYTIPYGVEKVHDDAIGEYCPFYNLTIPQQCEIGSAFDQCVDLKYVNYLGYTVPEGSCNFKSSSQLSYACVPGNYQDSEYCGKPAVSCDDPYTILCGNGLYSRLSPDTGFLSVDPMHSECTVSCSIPETMVDSVKAVYVSNGFGGVDNSIISNSAFEDLTELKKVQIDGHLKRVGDNAFAGCNKLTRFYYGNESEPECGSDVFKYCSKLEYVCVPKDYEKDTFCGVQAKKDCFATVRQDISDCAFHIVNNRGFEEYGMRKGNDMYIYYEGKKDNSSTAVIEAGVIRTDLKNENGYPYYIDKDPQDTSRCEEGYEDIDKGSGVLWYIFSEYEYDGQPEDCDCPDGKSKSCKRYCDGRIYGSCIKTDSKGRFVEVGDTIITYKDDLPKPEQFAITKCDGKTKLSTPTDLCSAPHQSSSVPGSLSVAVHYGPIAKGIFTIAVVCFVFALL